MVNDNTRLTDDALAELARLAVAATPGPWRTMVKGNTVQSLAIEGVCSGISPKTGNGPYIAAADPSTVAALVAEVRALRAAVAEMVDYAEHSFERREPGVTCRSCAVVGIGRAALDGAE